MNHIWDNVERNHPNWSGTHHYPGPEIKGYTKILPMDTMQICFFDIHDFAHETHEVNLSINWTYRIEIPWCLRASVCVMACTHCVAQAHCCALSENTLEQQKQNTTSPAALLTTSH